MPPNGVASLRGIRLNFNQNDPLQGIFLIDTGKNEYRVSRILTHKGTHIVFQLPGELVPDEYSLEIRMISKNSKKIRKGTLTEKLTV